MEARLRTTLSGTDLAAAQACLDDATALVRQEAGRTWESPTDTVTTPPDAVVTIVLRLALRMFRNPEGAESETLGDWSRSGMGDGLLTEDERWIIRSAAGIAYDGTGTMTITPAYHRPNAGSNQGTAWPGDVLSDADPIWTMPLPPGV